MKMYTFTNGITVSKGIFVYASLSSIHKDNDVYENANKFDGFRFSKLRQQYGEKAKYLASNTNPDFLQFGHGPHAWYIQPYLNESHISPGRFFAVNEIKLMLAIFLLQYDVKLRDGIRPADVKIGPSIAPSRTAKVLLKRRDFCRPTAST